MEMFLSGDRFDADWALRVGMVNRVFPQERLLAETLLYAEKLAGRAPIAHRLGKEVMLRALGRPIEDGLRMESRSFHDIGQTRDLDEGTRAFSEKRDAKFEGR
jgi:enoyl-CoA hydratase/carnithine racemase